MSSPKPKPKPKPKPFEKTFSRKNKPSKKITLEDNEHQQVLLLALAANTQPSNGLLQPSQTPKKPRDNKPTTKIPKSDKHQQTQTHKRKLKSELNGDQGSNKKKMKDVVKVVNGDGDDNQQGLNNKKKKEKENNGMPTKRKSKKSDKVGKEREEKENSECAFPTARVARIIKSEGSDYRLSSEAVFLINKATEKFIGSFSNDAYDLSVQEGKSYVGYKHLATTVSQEKRFDFLSDFIPEKLTAEKAMAERKPVEKSPT